MISARQAAWVFATLVGIIVAFQLALALGAPWGEFAMGGRYPGRFPPELRIAAIVQAAILAGLGWLMLARAGLAGAGGRWLRPAAWAVVGLSAVAATLNLITPSHMERLIWAPVAILLLACAIRVAASR